MPEVVEKIAKTTGNTIPSQPTEVTPVSKVAINQTTTPPDEIQTEKLTDVKNEIKPSDIDSLIPSDPYYLDPLFYEVANYFGLKTEDYAAAKNKLSEIVDYVIRDLKSNAPEDVLRGLRKLEDTVQPPSWDEKRYTNIYRYIRLASKQQTIKQAMSAFEKGAKANGS